jgi:hypothetical protein
MFDREIFFPLMEPDDSFPSSQGAATGPHLEPVEYKAYHSFKISFGTNLPRGSVVG